MKSTRQQTSQDCLLDLIGLPYKEYDCWDIIKVFYRKAMEIDLVIGDYDRWTISKKEISRLVEIESCNFRKVVTPEFGDIIVFRVLGIASHVGVFVGNGSFLHTMEKTGCVIDKLAKWEKRIEGIYRHDKV